MLPTINEDPIQSRIICLLLAAGSASRMGQSGRLDVGDFMLQQPLSAYRDLPNSKTETPGIPKMLLPFNGKTLLQHHIDEVKKVTDLSLLVVTGCYHNLLKDILASQQVSLLYNANWESGMGSSIQKGISELKNRFPAADGVLIMVCDQPFIDSTLLQSLLNERHFTGKGIIACSYQGTEGPPVLFDKKYFSALAELQGPQGAKKIIMQYPDDTAKVEFPLGAIDIDTTEDYQTLIRRETL